jgi:hypothetical protein
MWNNFSIGHVYRWLWLAVLLGSGSQAIAQKRAASYHGGAMQVYSLQAEGARFQVCDLDLSRGSVRAVYFGQQGGAQYQAWQKRHRSQVLCYLAVGFAQDWAPDQPPLGLAVERGAPLNRALDAQMDGLVLVDERGALTALDLNAERVAGQYSLRRRGDQEAFLRSMRREQASAFQTQLMYSHALGAQMGEDRYGKKAARRFLAICQDQQGHTHHLVMDLNQAKPLNLAAKQALAALQKRGYQVRYLLNQDTGSRNIMAAFDERQKRLYAAPVVLDRATQLLVYYLH